MPLQRKHGSEKPIKNMKGYLTSIICLMTIFGMSAQSYLDESLSADFRAKVKSLDEFKARFNGEESKPGLEGSENQRLDNFLSLFDFDIEKDEHGTKEFQDKMNGFIAAVLEGNNNFNIHDSGLFAVCTCRMLFDGKERKINLILQSESIDSIRYRWAIVGITGLEKAGIIKTDKRYNIDPTQHEIHFLGLHDFLNANPKNAFGYRSKYSKIDNLSVFFALIQTGNLKFDIVENQVYHYFDIPGYIFTIEELNREGNNTGWLISSLKRANDFEKTLEINKLLGNE